MIEVTIKQLAEENQISVERLLQQLAELGLNKNPSSTVTKQEKQKLLNYWQDNTSPSRLTLQRKTRSTLNVASGSGKSKAIQVEVRKKRTYIKRTAAESVAADENPMVTIDDTSKITTEVDIHQPLSTSPITSTTPLLGSSAKVKTVVGSPFSSRMLQTKKQQNSPKSSAKKTVEADPQSSLLATEREKLEAQANALKRKAEEEARRKVEVNARRLTDEARKLAEENAQRWAQAEQQATLQEDYHITTSRYAREAEDEADRRDESGRRAQLRSGKNSKQKKSSRLSETKAAREEERANSRSGKGKPQPSSLQQSFTKPLQPLVREVVLGQTITVAELAAKMALKTAEVIKVLIKLGIMATINQSIEQEPAQLVVEELGHRAILRQENQLEANMISERERQESIPLAPRAPVVTIMGHVDHGKTSLLDSIRSAKVAAGEAGGITQHIGAYHVETENGMITFLDTPGHAAFTAMRARGAKVTDIVVLVVAADDGVMPQTIEAIQHARAANVPLVVAVNKMDKPGADPQQVQQALSQHGVLAESWGGDTQFIPVSAKTGAGIEDLLNAILLQAEILELKSVPTGMAQGIVIESFLDRGRGPVATILVQQGILRKGDVILCGFEYGRVRAMRDERGQAINMAGPSMPVEVLGLSGVSTAGEAMVVVHDERKARELALYRQSKHREHKLAGQQRVKLENLFTQTGDKPASEISIVLKADVQGSVEAITDALLRLSTDEVKVRIVGSGVGALTETDATLAAASRAILIGFNVRADSSARRVIDNEGLDLHYYSVIYDLIDEVKQAMSGLLSPEYKQQIIGLAEVRDIFNSPKFGTIAGCMVVEGAVRRHNSIRVLREHVVIYQGELESLRRFKEDVNEVRNGMECGIGVKNYTDVRRGDMIEVFETIEIQRSIH
ncbi:MAG: translation initiation factor IF-2 [Candidatus Symbiodolus clandestinus]